jgi:hypothetical protein
MLFVIAGCGTAPSMLLRHFDVMLSSDENERSSLAMLLMKSRGLKELGRQIFLRDLFSLESDVFENLDEAWPDRILVCDDFGCYEANERITKRNWDTALSNLGKHGAFVVNCKGASFADLIIVPQGGEFVILLQEKQREVAKAKAIAGKAVPSLKVANVRKEHSKCRVDTTHLFVMITDEQFNDFAYLEPNEIVLSHNEHVAVMGPLLALLRKFNHSNKRTIVVQ